MTDTLRLIFIIHHLDSPFLTFFLLGQKEKQITGHMTKIILHRKP